LTPLALRNIKNATNCALKAFCLNALCLLINVIPPVGLEETADQPASALAVKEDDGDRDITMHLATVGVVGILGIIIGRVAFKPQ
jgi:hypothetical protein